MIVKEADKKNSSNPRIKAGIAAEDKMAFYLKRYFADNEEILIFNDLRIVVDDEVAQIDHLVFMNVGFIIIESKSVTTEVEVNEHGEWSRKINGRWQGFSSPIFQAERQYHILFKYLEKVKPLVLRFGIKKKWTSFPHTTIAAISDNGRIIRPQNDPLDNVMKAERVHEKILQIKDLFINPPNQGFFEISPMFGPKSRKEIADLLLEAHTPLIQEKPRRERSISNSKKTDIQKNQEQPPQNQIKKPNPPEENTETKNSHPACKKCGEKSNLEIRYGRSYYIHCLSCETNTSIHVRCDRSRCSARLQKRGLEFFINCTDCNKESLFHKNK